ncbi:MAG: methyltransferase domain-containing protein [Candidatus Bathyarchaeota archaeon]|nr:methyltransferase domain-containing protein [Candidatus Bathyarchaeota archaeon]
MSDDVAKRYDSISQEYEGRFQSGYREEIQNAIVFDTLNEFLENEKLRIFDAGGGTGFYSIPLAAKGHDVVILDISEKMLEVAESKASVLGIQDRVDILLGDMERIEMPDASFDVVLCHLALCYANEPSRALSEFSRLLRKRGLLSLIVENKLFFSISEAFKGDISEALRRLRESKLAVTVPALGRLRTFERNELLTLLERVNLKPIKILGLRIFSDYLLYAHKAPPEDVESLREIETILSCSTDYNSIGRFHFIICQKT